MPCECREKSGHVWAATKGLSIRCVLRGRWQHEYRVGRPDKRPGGQGWLCAGFEQCLEMMAPGCGKAGAQEVISMALGATPMVEGPTSEGQGDAYLGGGGSASAFQSSGPRPH